MTNATGLHYYFGMKNTKNLNLILKELKTGPKTALQVKKQLAQVNKSVIYRTIERLRLNQKIQEIQLANGSLAYELIEQGHHHHLICIHCNYLACTKLPKDLSMAIQIFENNLSKNNILIDHRVDFFIICNNCNNREK